MHIAFRGGPAIPLWTVAFCAVALSAPQRAGPFLTTFLAIAVIASTIAAIGRWLGPSRRRVELLPAGDDVLPPAGLIVTAGTRTRTLDEAIDRRTVITIDAADLQRMDDDGGWQRPRQSAAGGRAGARAPSGAFIRSAAAMIPGAREPGALTISASMPLIPEGPGTMDAATIAEYQREGGGAPSQRRPRRERVRWTGPGRMWHPPLMATRSLFGWRFRANHA